MANIAWKQAVLDSADAVRSVLGHNDKILVKDLCNIIRGLKPNTSDATVEPNEVMNGEIAYGPEGKIIGTAPFEYIKTEYKAGITTWTQTELPSSTYNSIAYGNGKFVAIGYIMDDNWQVTTGIAAYSEDGITWTETILPISDDWNSVTYGNGKFVIIADYSNIVLYSEDGINWSQTTLPVSDAWVSVAYGDGKFVAIANESTKAVYSTDGIAWTQIALPSSYGWTDITYGNGKFVAVTAGTTSPVSSKAAYSTDGINWTSTTLSTSADWGSVAYGNNKFVAISGYSQTNYRASWSEDGINWNTIILPVTGGWASIIYAENKFMVIGSRNENREATNIILYSEDGINWELITLPVSNFWSSVAYGDNKFVTISIDSNIAVYSGITLSNYKVLEQSVLSANGCEDRTLYISNNEIVLDSMFTKINANV